MTLRVVTLPPTVAPKDAVGWARDARRLGADVLEVRNDLHEERRLSLAPLAEVMPVLASERAGELGEDWAADGVALRVDVPLERRSRVPAERLLLSHHADAPMRPEDALRMWVAREPREGAWIKHVEPLGDVRDGWRILETRALLAERFGNERVTALVTGPLALPFRAVAAAFNALDYVALSSKFLAAPGQRLLADAVRSARGERGPRRGILGSGIALSRSPSIHRQPFDRIDLPGDAPLEPLLGALREHYVGLSVTAPFKQQVAKLVGSGLPAVNTLHRVKEDGPLGSRWQSANTDVDGATRALTRLEARSVTVLGSGGAADALELAGSRIGVDVSVRRREELVGAHLDGDCIWTWPEEISAPEGLRFLEHARVGVVAYGARAQRVAERVRACQGRPVFLGATWFVAQARAQRALFEAAR